MRLSGYSVATFAATCLVCGAAFAHFPGHGHWHSGPAPLLAAGVPAFAALGGGAAFTKLVRRFRNRRGLIG